MRRLYACCKKWVCFVLIGICLLGMLPVSGVQAEERTVRGEFTSCEHFVSREYAYSDDYFMKPAEQYNHDLARLSLGVALAAFRNEASEEVDDDDDNLAAMLQDMGFSQIETETYDTEPTKDSVAYGMGFRKIGDTVVLACAVCGGNYGKEWASNLTVEDGERSKGFEDSAQKVQAAIADYRSRNLASVENVKLWIVGFSRGAAIANLTAADCIASGAFADVYAYTYATPRTTRNPVSYPNIYNIIQKEDLVPKIPLADWGFERYGQDLLIVSPETDSDCMEIMERAEENYREMTGVEMVNNTEINAQLRIMFDYLLLLFGTPADYSRDLQPLLVELLTEGEDIKNALKLLLNALQQYSTDDPAVGEELKAFRDYLGTMVEVYYLQGGLEDLPPDQWDQQLGIGNLFNAHLAFEYLAMMYASDDPAVLFSDNTEYIRLIIYGETDISVSDGSRLLKEIRADGTELADGKPNAASFPDVTCYSDKTVISLPADRSYTLSLTSRSALPQTVSYTGFLFSGNTLRAQADNLYSYFMAPDETAVIRTSTQGRAIEPDTDGHADISVFTDVLYSPTTAMRMETNSVVHLTISGAVNRLLLIIVILLGQLVASIILRIRRKKKHLKRNVVVAFIWHTAMAMLFAVFEVSMWYFIPVIPLIRMIPALLVFIVIEEFARKGCREVSGKRKTFWIIIAALAAFILLGGLLGGDFAVWKTVVLLAVYTGFLLVVFRHLWHDPVKNA